MSNRYTPVGNWRTDPEPNDIHVWGADHRYRQYVYREVCDLREVTGYVWKDGAWKVTVKRPSGCKATLPRGRTFKGEFAWSDSRRYVEDAISKIRTAMEGT